MELLTFREFRQQKSIPGSVDSGSVPAVWAVVQQEILGFSLCSQPVVQGHLLKKALAQLPAAARK